MIVVSDTTPIISLLKIGKLSLLHDLYGEVIVPGAVYEELTANESYADEAQAVASSEFLVRRDVDNRGAVSVLQRVTGLHLGESEALVLADQIQADLVLLDELSGRSAARSMNLEYTGTIGILAAGYRKGVLSKQDVDACVDILKSSGRHISDALYEELINVANSREGE